MKIGESSIELQELLFCADTLLIKVTCSLTLKSLRKQFQSTTQKQPLYECRQTAMINYESS